MARLRGEDTIRVDGLDAFRRELRKLDEAGLIDGLKDANQSVAQLVVDRARLKARALGGMEARAAETLAARRGQRAAEVSFGGSKAPFAAGAEFGAYRNKLRLRKSTGGRAYIVRKESQAEIRKTIKRIEARSNPNTGQRSEVTGKVRGWNQFKQWRGNSTGAGFFLFPAIRDNADEIVEMYGDAIDRLTAQAFPD